MRATATGLDFPAHFLVSVNQGSPIIVPREGTIEIVDLKSGDHTITVVSLPANCTLIGANPKIVTITSREPVSVTFTFSCVTTTGVIVAELVSSGLDQPDRSRVSVSRQGGSTLSFPTTAPAIFSGVSAGQHTLTLNSVGANCSLQGENPRTVSVTVGTATRDTARTTFERSCVATSGVVEVTVATTGDDPDHDGYGLRVGTQSQSGVRDGVKHVSVTEAGEYQVSLEGIASNCVVENGAQRTVSVTLGGTTRDTARTAFQLACVRVPLIAFTRWVESGGYDDTPYVTVSRVDGSEARRVKSNALGHSASWSPDGRRLLFVATDDCYYGCQSTGLVVVEVNGGALTRLTTHRGDGAPAWSPDGSKIAFERDGEIMVMNADGSSLRTLVARDAAAGRHFMGGPAWSPDGTRIAFTCVTKSGTPIWYDICLASAEGTGVVRVSTDPWYDADPSWSPDGTRLAITTDRNTTDGTYGIAVMGVDGSNITRLANGSQPTWSPDGTRILFGNGGIFSVSPDGTNLTRITSEPDGAPAWRP